MLPRIERSIALTVIALAAGTALFALVPYISFGYRGANTQTALQTAATVVSLLAAFILYGRLHARRTRFELLLFTSLVLLVAANLGRAVVPSFDGTNDAVIWVPLTLTVGAGGVLALAAFARDQPLAQGTRPFLVPAGALVAMGTLAAIVGLLAGQFPTGVDPGLSPAQSGTPRVVGTDGFLATQLLAMALFALAGLGLARRARGLNDELLVWLTLAAVWLAFARLNYLLFPSIYSEWIFTGDVLRFGAYLLILVGALREIAVYQRRAAEAAIAEERHRIARDLHDGLVQDLAFIAMQADQPDEGRDRAQRIAKAARAAIRRSRGAIADLRSGGEPLGQAVAHVASALTSRSDVLLELEVDPTLEVSDAMRDDLLRLVSEALSNAIRHGGASRIGIELEKTGAGGMAMEISDDGRGFEPARLGSVMGLGIMGMRERVSGLGGDLRIESSPGAGTRVKVLLP